MHQMQKIGWKSATALVLANMIGTGVFTSLGFQVSSTSNTWSILILWTLGGLVALAGAFSYAELGAALRRSGGEYHYLSQIYHPLAGYLSGWVSLTVGFSAPVALAAMAMGAYVSELLPWDPTWTATAVVVSVSLIHSLNIRKSSQFQNVTTLLKVILIVGFVVAGLLLGSPESALDWSSTWQSEMLMPAFAVSLVYVTYSYTGWNAAAYIAEEIREVEINLPKALIRGTLLVTILYVLLQLVFLSHSRLDQLAGKVEVGQVAAINLFGKQGGEWVSMAIALFLVSSISAMVWVGPRVSLVMAQDHRLWHFLSTKNSSGIPVRAVWFQAMLSLGMIWTGTFEQVLLYCGFILQLFSALSVAGVFLLRKRGVSLAYRNPTHPWLPAFFILVSIWILSFLMFAKPFESLLGMSNLALGVLTYTISRRIKSKR